MSEIGWMEQKDVTGVFELLTQEGIEFFTKDDPVIKHTLFMVNEFDRSRVGDICANKFGRFALENQEIELTEAEERVLAEIYAKKEALVKEKEEKRAARILYLKTLGEEIKKETDEHN